MNRELQVLRTADKAQIVVRHFLSPGDHHARALRPMRPPAADATDHLFGCGCTAVRHVALGVAAWGRGSCCMEKSMKSKQPEGPGVCCRQHGHLFPMQQSKCILQQIQNFQLNGQYHMQATIDLALLKH